MLIELNNIFNNDGECFKFDYTMDLSSYDLNGQHPFASPVSIVGKVFNNVGVVKLEANASFRYVGICDRCADDITKDFVVPIEHFLVQSLNNEDNDDYIIVPDMKLDLDELVLTDMLLSLPSKNLCSDDCKGLCSMCGQNLNHGHCNCKKDVDPRLASLLQLLEE